MLLPGARRHPTPGCRAPGPRRRRCGGQAGGVLLQVALGYVVGGEGEAVVDLGQDEVLLLQDDVQLLAEDLGVEEVLYPQADPGRLVRVGRPDTPLGRPQPVLAQVTLRQGIDLLVVRHDQVGATRYDEAGAVHPPGFEGVDLVQQHLRLHHDAVADHRSDVGVQDAAREQLEGEALAVDHDPVAGIVAPLVPHDHLHLPGQQVGELSFALVAPLGAKEDGGGHAATVPHARGLRPRPRANRPI